jgi:Trk K+ transport system NAD-binding subunit
LKETTGLTIIGIWDRGVFINARPETIIQNSSLIALAGTEEQMNLYNELFCIYHASDFPVIIIGRGRVGTAIAKSFESKGIDYRIVDKNPNNNDRSRTIVGSASDISVLEKAGIRNAPAVIITTHDDATNIYLTIYCRRLRPDMQMISRASLDRNISTLNRAGSDLVISYASLGANYILNYLTRKETVMIAEGLFIFELKTPSILYGLKLAESNVRQETGCSVIAVKSEKGIIINPVGDYTLQPEDNLILIGSSEGEKKFYELFMNSTSGNNRKNSKK